MNYVPLLQKKRKLKYRPRVVWTEEMLWRLKKAYNAGGLPRAYEAIPEHSKEAIRTAATRYEIHEPLSLEESGARPWKSWEDNILRQWYAKAGPIAIASSGEMNRTKLAITKRAAVLGIQQVKPRENTFGNPWSEAETKILLAAMADRTFYFTNGVPTYILEWPTLIEKLPGRTRKSIEAKCYVIKTEGAQKRQAHRLWTAEEDQILIENYRAKGASAMCTRLNRSRGSVLNRANVMKLTRPYQVRDENQFQDNGPDQECRL